MMDLNSALKNMVIAECRVQDVTAEQIKDEFPVIGGTEVLRLDSLDAVEIVTAMERNFGLKAETMGPMKNIFRSFGHFTDFVIKNAPAEKIEAFISKYNV